MFHLHLFRFLELNFFVLTFSRYWNCEAIYTCMWFLILRVQGTSSSQQYIHLLHPLPLKLPSPPTHRRPLCPFTRSSQVTQIHGTCLWDTKTNTKSLKTNPLTEFRAKSRVMGVGYKLLELLAHRCSLSAAQFQPCTSRNVYLPPYLTKDQVNTCD